MKTTEPVHHADKYPNAMCARHTRRRAQRRIRAAIEAMERRILLSTIAVNTVADRIDPPGSGTVSLRDAIDQANHARGPVSIAFDPVVFAKPQTIMLVGTGLELQGNTSGAISITGPAAGLTIRSVTSGGELQVDNGAAASISGIAFTTENSEYYVTAISVENGGTLTITNCSILHNLGTDAAGIRNRGRLTIAASLISNNRAAQGPGGGIENFGQLTITDSTISGNTSTSAGGGGIYNAGVATVTNCAILDNHCVFMEYGPYQTPYGGGIDNAGQLTVTNSTIVGNGGLLGVGFQPGSSLGGGIYNSGTASVTACTISGNAGVGGGIFNRAGNTLALADSIVADNLPIVPYGRRSVPIDVAGVITSRGHNLIGKSDGSSGWIKADFKGSVAHPMDPHLAPLDNYGGPTPTEFPTTGSRAIAGGSARLLPAGLSTDQRGFNRVTNGLLDIGAVELQRSGVITVKPPAHRDVVAGVPATISLGSFSEAPGKGPFSVIINWGDGSPNTNFSLASAGSLGSMVHAFTNVGALTGSIIVRDAAGNLSQPTAFSITAATHPPVAIVVNSTKDTTDPRGSATVTLRDAIDMADGGFGPFTITFDPKVFAAAQAITLRHGTLSVAHNIFGLITLTGPAAGLIMVGDQKNRVLNVGKGVSINLRGVVITGGAGGIENAGTMNISRCTISHNTAINGGGIESSGKLTLIDSTISGNEATGTTGYKGSRLFGQGGGVDSGGDLTIDRCTFSDNEGQYRPYYNGPGGGIYCGGTLTITNSVVTANGSGIFCDGPAVISNCTITKNQGTGIESDQAPLQVNNCNISQNGGPVRGGGMFVRNATITNSSICGNSAFDAGGIYALGKVNVFNCTIANNVAFSDFGGGIDVEVDARVTAINCTITANSAREGGGVYCAPAIQNPEFPRESALAGVLIVANTIIADNINHDAGSAPDVFGGINSLGHNLIGQTNGSRGWISSDLTGRTSAPLDPKLAPLGHYGGRTQSEVPLAGSPALGAGSVALVPAGVTTDQRGKPRIVNGKVDIGSVQVQALPRITIVGPPDQSTIGGTPLAAALGSFADPLGKAPFYVLLHWGDGTPDTFFSLRSAGSLGTQTHVFSATGVYHASIAMTDSTGALSNTALFNITVTLAPKLNIVVNTTADQTDPAGSKTVSLRDAIGMANHRFGAVSITFDPVVFVKDQTITLGGSQLDLTGNTFAPITLTGPAAGVTISGNDISGIFFVDQKVTAAFSGLTLVHGQSFSTSARGGAINNSGNLTLLNSTVEDNTSALGGGMYNTGTLVVRGCTIASNSAQTGGGILNDNGGELDLNDSTISGDVANDREGGGIFNAGVAYLTGCTLTKNHVRFGYSNDRYGSEGGAIANEDQVFITNCTISGNSADNSGMGGALFNDSRAVIADSTITNNSGYIGGVDNVSGSNVLIFNSIIAGDISTAPASARYLAPDFGGIAQSLGHNLIGKTNGSSGWIKSDLTGTIAHPLDPHLSALGDFGGPTQTQVPLAGSPAIGAGSVANAQLDNLTTDQRGKPRVVNGKVDIGAVEVQANESH